MPDPVLGHRLFADGVTRPVRLDAAGKQYVVGPDGQRVHGLWVLPAEVPADEPVAGTACAFSAGPAAGR